MGLPAPEQKVGALTQWDLLLQIRDELIAIRNCGTVAQMAGDLHRIQQDVEELRMRK